MVGMFFLLKLLNGIGGLNVYVYRQSVSPISTWAFVGPCRRCWKEITVRRPLAGGFPCFVCVGLLLEPLKRITFWSRCEDVNSHVQSQRSVTKLCGTEIGEKNRHDINQKRLVTFSTRNRKRFGKTSSRNSDDTDWKFRQLELFFNLFTDGQPFTKELTISIQIFKIKFKRFRPTVCKETYGTWN